MTDREKLVELIQGNMDRFVNPYAYEYSDNAERFADHLIANGVTVKQTTTDSFLEKVKETIRKHNDDVEVMHSVLDELMEDVLIELGYAEAVEHIRDSERWYA